MITMLRCPVCGENGCDEWARFQTQTWHRPPAPKFKPITPVEPGALLPCGENPSGKIREFFANKADVDDLLTAGIRIYMDGTVKRFRCELTSTPHYANGDVQIRAIEEAA